jgi:UDP-2,3-diacylglucosamine pyrophosphatase LpxH
MQLWLTRVVFGLAFFLSRVVYGQTVTIGVIGDVNGSACQTKYPSSSLTAFGSLLQRRPLDQIIMTGDAVHGECMNYKGKEPYQAVVSKMWDEFDTKFVRVAQATRGLDIVLAPGNHDAPYLFSNSRAGFHTENAGFVEYWNGLKPRLGVLPLEIPGAGSNYPYYWAYVHEDVLFVVLQSTRTHSLSNALEQKRWLRAVLSSTTAKGARARIAFGHVPAYPVLDPSVGSKYSEIIEKEQVGVQGGLIDLLIDHRVDLLISGHSHAPYPAELTRKTDQRKLKILSMPCGHASRKLNSEKEVSPRGYAVVEIDDANKVGVKIHNWSDGKEIAPSYFPPAIDVKSSKVTYRRME